MAVPLRQVWTLTVHSSTSVKHKKKTKSSLRRKYGFGLLQYWIISLVYQNCSMPFQLKVKKGHYCRWWKSYVQNEELTRKIWQKRYNWADNLPDQIFSSPCCQQYNSYDVSSENLVLDQLIIPKLIFFFLLIPYLVDIVLIVESQRGFFSWLDRVFHIHRNLIVVLALFCLVFT